MQSSDINMIFFYLNKQVHKLLHNHLSELWEFGVVTLHLLVQNPFKELKESDTRSDKLNKSKNTRACCYVFELRNGYQQQRVVWSIVLQ